MNNNILLPCCINGNKSIVRQNYFSMSSWWCKFKLKCVYTNPTHPRACLGTCSPIWSFPAFLTITNTHTQNIILHTGHLHVSRAVKQTAPRNMCRKVEVKKKRKEKIKKLFTTEPHPALIQLKNEKQSMSRRGQRNQDNENEDYKNTRGWIKEERDWCEWHTVSHEFLFHELFLLFMTWCKHQRL